MTRTSVALLVVMVGSTRSGTALSDNPEPDNPMLVGGHPDRLDLCRDESDIVGKRQCPTYGLWGAAREGPYMFAAVGFTMRRLPRSHDQPASPAIARMTTESPAGDFGTGSDSSLGYVQRLSVTLASPLYLAFEAEIGFSELRGTDPSVRKVRAAAAGIAGLRIGTGPFVIGAEIAGGGRVIETDLGQRMYGAPVLEARVLADLWLSPWCTIGGTVGTGLLDRDERMAGLFLGFHTYSFGGR